MGLFLCPPQHIGNRPWSKALVWRPSHSEGFARLLQPRHGGVFLGLASRNSQVRVIKRATEIRPAAHNNCLPGRAGYLAQQAVGRLQASGQRLALEDGVDTPVAVDRQLGDDRLNPATSLSSRSGGRPIRFFARSRMRSIRLEPETPITSATVFIGAVLRRRPRQPQIRKNFFRMNQNIRPLA